MRVIGTAGHVDHGKSTLVKRLTNIDPDRLAEEKAREMTIDLGFAWLHLPGGEIVGIIDVPGHRDFIENMLAGVGGMDAVMLVIAADEGVMPQTREHLAIVDLLGIRNGLVALTKTDLVDDPDWLELVERDIYDTLQDTTLRDVGIVRVSARTGFGVDRIVTHLVNMLASMPPRADYHYPRLPIDRVFSITGFGTVVTGTLLGGRLHLGYEVEIQPVGIRGRIRGLQSYRQSVQVAEPGSRVAVNLAGVERQAVERGCVLTLPGQLAPTTLIDVWVRHLKDSGRVLKHNAEIKFFAGAAETSGHVRLLADDELQPGAEGWLQIRLVDPLALAQGDRFILRYPSPSQTIGGGIVVNPHPERRWRRFQADVIQQLAIRKEGTPVARLAQAALQREPVKRTALQKLTGYNDDQLDMAICQALDEGLLHQFQDGAFMAVETRQGVLREIIVELQRFHQAEPLRLGMQREELRSRLGLKNAALNAVLEAQPDIIAERDVLRLSAHHIRFSDEQQRLILLLRQKMDAAPYAPPSTDEAAEIVGRDVLYALMDLGEIVQVQDDVIFSREVFEELVTALLEMIDSAGQVTAANLRDRFGTTRKYAIGLLEYLDAQGMTRRVGDARVRGRLSR